MVPVGLAGEATTSPAKGATACACSSIFTDGWKRSAGPQASSTTSQPSEVKMFRYAG